MSVQQRSKSFTIAMHPVQILLFVFSLVGLVGIVRSKEESEFKKISDYLVKKTDTDDLKKNFESAESWIESSRESCKRGDCLDAQLNKSLEDFVSLYKATQSDRKCSPSTHELLRRNRNASNIKASWYVPNEGDRISKVILSVGKDLAENCSISHKSEFERKIKRLDQDRLAVLNSRFQSLSEAVLDLGNDTNLSPTMRMHRILDYYLGNTAVGRDRKRFLTFIERQLGSELLPRANVDTKVKKEAESRVKTFMDKYFNAPCDFFLREMQETLDPMLDYIKLKGYRQDMLERQEFYLYLGKYNMCKLFKNDQGYNAFILVWEKMELLKQPKQQI